MSVVTNLKKFLVIIFAGVALTACATQVKKQTGMMQGMFIQEQKLLNI